MPFPALMPLLHDREEDVQPVPDEEQKAAERTVNGVSKILVGTAGFCYTINKLYASTAAIEGYKLGRDDVFNGHEARYLPNSPYNFVAQYGLAAMTTFALPYVQGYINLITFRGSKILGGFCTLGIQVFQDGLISRLLDEIVKSVNYASAYYNIVTTFDAPKANPMSHVLIEEPRIEVMDAVCAAVSVVSFMVAMGAGITFFNNRRAQQQRLLEHRAPEPVVVPVAPVGQSNSGP